MLIPSAVLILGFFFFLANSSVFLCVLRGLCERFCCWFSLMAILAIRDKFWLRPGCAVSSVVESSQLLRNGLDELVIEIHAIVEVLHSNAFIFAVGAIVIHIGKHAGNAISRNAGDAQVLSVAGAV